MKLILAYITTKDKKQAQEIGHKLVEERLAACANIVDGMQSIYWWEGSFAMITKQYSLQKPEKVYLKH